MGESQSLKKDKWVLSESEGERLSHPRNLGNGLKVLNLSYRVQRRFNDGRDQNMPLPNMSLWQRIILSRRQLRNSRHRKSTLPSPICLKTEHKFAVRRLPSFYQEGESTLITGEDVSRLR